MKLFFLSTAVLLLSTFSFGATQGQFSQLLAAGTEANCPIPTTTNPVGVCATTSGFEVSKGVGVPYSPVATMADLNNVVAGVSTFAGRTGTVVPAQGDYTWSLLNDGKTPLPTTLGGTGQTTAPTEGVVAGSGLVVTGTWPNQQFSISQITPAQLPATTTCSLKVTAVNADGSLAVTLSSCK